MQASTPILAVTLLLLVVVGGVAYMHAQSTAVYAAHMAKEVRTFAELRDRFEELAHTRGGVFAFEVLAEAELPPNTDVHLLGHAIGDVLYEQKGINGMADCTQEFRNACSHTMVIGAFAEHGDAALPAIREACLKAPGGVGAYTMCYHGLGHGIFAYTGYDIPKTVALCAKTGTEDRRFQEVSECFGGAIMELMGGGGHDNEGWLAARERYLKAPRTPCSLPIVPEKLKPACYTYLTPHMWEAAGLSVGAPDPALWSKAFSYCEDVPVSEAKAREACYGGFGKEFPLIAAGREIRDFTQLSKDEHATVHAWCDAARMKDGVAACVRAVVFSLFWGGESNPGPAFAFCEASDEHASACFGALDENIELYSLGVNQKELCARLPEESQVRCAAFAP